MISYSAHLHLHSHCYCLSSLPVWVGLVSVWEELVSVWVELASVWVGPVITEQYMINLSIFTSNITTIFGYTIDSLRVCKNISF